MKKLLFGLLILALLLTGCEKNTQETAPASVFELTGEGTADGVKVGDGKEEFIKAYRQYTVQAAFSDTVSSYMVMSIESIPYDENISTLIATFFINGKPKTEAQICEDNDIEESELADLLSSPVYLRSHDVVYRYLRFTWEGGEITDITSDELNYNETFEVPRLD